MFQTAKQKPADDFRFQRTKKNKGPSRRIRQRQTKTSDGCDADAIRCICIASATNERTRRNEKKQTTETATESAPQNSSDRWQCVPPPPKAKRHPPEAMDGNGHSSRPSSVQVRSISIRNGDLRKNLKLSFSFSSSVASSFYCRRRLKSIPLIKKRQSFCRVNKSKKWRDGSLRLVCQSTAFVVFRNPTIERR